jgi:hypothetical protein
MPESKVWYQAHDTTTGSLWCETSDPDDPYLLPTEPGQRLQYRTVTVTYVPHSDVQPWTPPRSLLSRKHPSLEDDGD